MTYYYDVKGVGKTIEECKASYAQALEDADLDVVLYRKALLRNSIIQLSDGTWEQKPSQSCFLYNG
tara:strand:- start:167 stop:364 length:198 start_codon:yes stop_codon:yes gene_type:complete